MEIRKGGKRRRRNTNGKKGEGESVQGAATAAHSEKKKTIQESVQVVGLHVTPAEMSVKQ